MFQLIELIRRFRKFSFGFHTELTLDGDTASPSRNVEVDLKPKISNAEEHAAALARIDVLANEPELEPTAARELEALAARVCAYENEAFPSVSLSPVSRLCLWVRLRVTGRL